MGLLSDIYDEMYGLDKVAGVDDLYDEDIEKIAFLAEEGVIDGTEDDYELAMILDAFDEEEKIARARDAAKNIAKILGRSVTAPRTMYRGLTAGGMKKLPAAALVGTPYAALAGGSAAAGYGVHRSRKRRQGR